jgi:uncharacterized repeat protein (TIGR03837 family)
LGVSWRLSADLAFRGHSVRLWVDDASSLAWMAPDAKPNSKGRVQFNTATGTVVVRPWLDALNGFDQPSKVWVEAFGCELPEHFVKWAHQSQTNSHSTSCPVWLNLEYLSAEAYVERSHKLPSPVMSGILKGRTKWFFYPGFNEKTGGLIREARVLEKSEAWETPEFNQSGSRPYPLKSTLFCYEPAALAEAMQLASLNSAGHQWQVAHGRGALAFENALRALPSHTNQPSHQFIPPLSQTKFDQLLKSSDLNFVRGEDSLVRAIWAGKAFVWQIYPQDDGAHGAKLNAFLDWLQAPDSLRRFHLSWNGLSLEPLPEVDLPAWQACAMAAQARLMQQMDLVSQLLEFVKEKR